MSSKTTRTLLWCFPNNSFLVADTDVFVGGTKGRIGAESRGILSTSASSVLTLDSMPEVQVVGVGDASVPYEPLRVLMPSPIGSVGVDLCGTVITGLVIVPDRKARAAYQPLHDLDESDVFDEIFGNLAEYFAGARRKLDLDFDLGPSGVTGFARRVLRETAKVGYGKTRTYSSLAEAAGRPDAYRQVLSILHENPIPILIPCHRVVTHKSGAGSFIAGEKKKRWLLDLERKSLDAIEE